MAKWTVTPETVNNSMTGTFEYDGSEGESLWSVTQEEKPYIEEVQRNIDEGTKSTHARHKKFATIPDIVAIEIMVNHGIDIHDPAVMGDRDRMWKFKQIVMQEYPYLVVNKA